MTTMWESSRQVILSKINTLQELFWSSLYSGNIWFWCLNMDLVLCKPVCFCCSLTSCILACNSIDNHLLFILSDLTPKFCYFFFALMEYSYKMPVLHLPVCNAKDLKITKPQTKNPKQAPRKHGTQGTVFLGVVFFQIILSGSSEKWYNVVFSVRPTPLLD